MTTISVSNLSELMNALAAARGGETILLEGGDYGDLSLTMKSGFNYRYPDTVTIASANPEAPAVFSSMDVRDAGNLTFDGIIFDYEFEAGDEIYYRPFNFTGNENLTIRNSVFDGDLAQGVSEVSDGYGYAIGLSVRGSSGVTVENTEFFEFYKAATFSQSKDLTVSENDIHSIRMDGLNFAQVENTLIQGNYIHDFKGSLSSTDHRDMIQFWTAGTDEPSKSITIIGNHLDIGEGSYSHSIFMRNEVVDRGQAGQEMLYRDLVIEDNVIVNSHAHGIYVGETVGLTVRNNTILHADGERPDGADPKLEIPRIHLASGSSDVVVVQNVVSEILGYDGQQNWTLDNNVFVQDQDPNDTGYYEDVFVTTSLSMRDGRHAFLVREDSPIDAVGAGASASYSGMTPNVHVVQSPDNAAMYVFDAGQSRIDGQPIADGTRYTWDFGNGQTVTGKVVEHAFHTGGSYTVALSIDLPDGSSERVNFTLGVEGDQLISFAPEAGIVRYDAGSATVLRERSETEREGIYLNGDGPSLVIDREYVRKLLHEDEFRIEIGLKASNDTSFGELFRLHESFIASIDPDGNLILRIFTEGGREHRILAEGAGLNDTQEHRIEVSLINDEISILVDGERLASAEIFDALSDRGDHDLIFGNPFVSNNFVGVLTKLDITINESDFREPIIDIASRGIVQEAIVDDGVMPMPDEQGDPALIIAPEELSVEPDISVLETLETPGLPDIDSGVYLSGEARSVSMRIARESASHLLEEDFFEISFALSATSSDSYGEVMRLHQSFLLNVTPDGEMLFRTFFDGEETARLITTNANILDTHRHEVSIKFEDGLLSVAVNGDVLASGEMAFGLGNTGRHDLTFGNLWTEKNFEGVVSDVVLQSKHEETRVLGIEPSHENEPGGQDLSELVQFNDLDGMSGNMMSYFQVSGEHLPGVGNGRVADLFSRSIDGMHHTSIIIDRFESDWDVISNEADGMSV